LIKINRQDLVRFAGRNYRYAPNIAASGRNRDAGSLSSRRMANGLSGG